MSQLSPQEMEVAELITQSLNLDIEPGNIDPAQALYREGLGLDSIDILELALVISKAYGFQIKSDAADNVQVFSSLAELARTVQIRRTR